LAADQIQEVDDGVGEHVVGIAGHHVARTSDVEVVGMRDEAAELGDPVLGEEVAVATPDE
jgi:hypothetical protein